MVHYQQIALFVIPFIITLGWILGKPLTLLFDPLESIVLFLSGMCHLRLLLFEPTDRLSPVLTVNYVVQDGKSNCQCDFVVTMCASSDILSYRARGNDSNVSVIHL